MRAQIKHTKPAPMTLYILSLYSVKLEDTLIKRLFSLTNTKYCLQRSPDFASLSQKKKAVNQEGKLIDPIIDIF